MLKRFSDISMKDVAICWWKWASLWEMMNAWLPIPNGFVLTTNAYWKDSKERENDVLQAFDELDTKFVAVRSSWTKEDWVDDSFAWQFDTYLFVTRENLIEKIKECHDSVNSERIISYCNYKWIDRKSIKVAVAIQKMVNSDSAWVCFTVNPVSQNYNEIMIDAWFWVWEAVVSWMITPDNYIVNKKTWEIKKNISQQAKKLVLSDKWWTEEVEITEVEQNEQKLSDENIKKLSELAVKIENHYWKPMDTEWAVENWELFMLQARPITTISNNENCETIYEFFNAESDSSLLSLCMQFKWVTSRKIKELIWIPVAKMILYLHKWDSSDGLIDKDYIEYFIHWCASALLKNMDIAKDLLNETRKICSDMREVWTEYKNQVRNLTEEDLVLLLRKIENLEMNGMLFWTPFAFSDMLWDITNKIKDIVCSKKWLSKDSADYINILSSPKQPSYTKLAYEEIWNLWNDISKRDYLLDKYYRLDQWYIGKWLTESELELLIEKNGKNTSQNDENNYDTLYKEINLTAEEEKYFELSRIIVEWKSLRWDARQFCFVIVNRIVERIAKERWVWEDLLNCLTCDELVEYIQNDTLPKWAYERLNWAIATITYDKQQKITVLTWDDRLEFEKKYIYHEIVEKSDSLHWQVAFHWKYKGKVKLIFWPQDNAKVNQWDILVAKTTTPQLLPAMVKAWAFITENWWITSHAAIIAREMKKPCIVWVKNLMEILKDDMCVEIDADNWTINIIKNK